MDFETAAVFGRVQKIAKKISPPQRTHRFLVGAIIGFILTMIFIKLLR